MTADISGGLRGLTGTLRFRVTAAATLAVLLVLTVAGLGLVLVQRAELTENVDDAIDQQAQAVVGQVRAGDRPEGIRLPADDVSVQVVGSDGDVIAASPALLELPAIAAAADAGARSVELPAAAGGHVRLLTRTVDGTAVHVAGSLEDVEDSTRALLQSLVLGVPLSAAVLAAIVWWSVGRSLRPVEAIRRQVAQVSDGSLGTRVPVPRAHDEIAALARTMNDMLARLDASAERQRRFVADASHELRSPLARIRSEVEVDERHPSSADLIATHRSVLEEIVVLQRLLDDLLLLARGDAGVPAGAGPPVDLDHVVAEEVRRLSTQTPLRVDASGVEAVQVRGDRAQLGRIVANLLDNAGRHAWSAVTVTVHEDRDGQVVLAVSDDGAGVPSAQADEVFQRFARLDDARSAAYGGAGLGLAIARDLAERHGGTLTLDVQHRPGARFVLRLPAHVGDQATGRRPSSPTAPHSG